MQDYDPEVEALDIRFIEANASKTIPEFPSMAELDDALSNDEEDDPRPYRDDLPVHIEPDASGFDRMEAGQEAATMPRVYVERATTPKYRENRSQARSARRSTKARQADDPMAALLKKQNEAKANFARSRAAVRNHAEYRAR